MANNNNGNGNGNGNGTQNGTGGQRANAPENKKTLGQRVGGLVEKAIDKGGPILIKVFVGAVLLGGGYVLGKGTSGGDGNNYQPTPQLPDNGYTYPTYPTIEQQSTPVPTPTETL